MKNAEQIVAEVEKLSDDEIHKQGLLAMGRVGNPDVIPASLQGGDRLVHVCAALSRSSSEHAFRLHLQRHGDLRSFIRAKPDIHENASFLHANPLAGRAMCAVACIAAYKFYTE